MSPSSSSSSTHALIRTQSHVTSAPLLGLLTLAGVALVAQNPLMARIATAGASTVAPLVLNSAVGLVALLTALLVQSGPSGLVATLRDFRAWYLLPGLLGSLFVFASVVGFDGNCAARQSAPVWSGDRNRSHRLRSQGPRSHGSDAPGDRRRAGDVKAFPNEYL
ncbi:MAG: hypothetical protein DI556_20765 [Rhodovulum sulfidophilum]|uniref:Uncharacterized protein n=1 Tax=Rhodovulum sulfidophilum TaxID=35806 RepID=A0A2W5N6C7_RHOSU|nr:MAG: hypothetical protein DI556_20765 [Rhodovulum sulfidophilum]